MADFQTAQLPVEPTYQAPDGSEVRILLGVRGGGIAHFQLGPGLTSRAAAHRTVDEIWYVLSGQGEMWRAKENAQEEVVVALAPGVCLTIPVGTRFQFRCLGGEALAIVGVTMPPWPGSDEAYEVEGKWEPTVV